MAAGDGCSAAPSVLQWWDVAKGSGYLTIARWQGAPVRAHWTLPLGAFVFGHGRIAPGYWLGFALVVLVHEIGHALVVRRFGLRVVSVDVHGAGGQCRWAGDATALQRARIAWGGVNAQLALFLATAGALAILGPPSTPLFAALADAFTSTNVFLIVLNLLPVPPLDGAEAWKLPGLLRAQSRARAGSRTAKHRAKAKRAAHLELVELDESEREVSPETAAAVEAKLRELAGGRNDKPN